VTGQGIRQQGSIIKQEFGGNPAVHEKTILHACKRKKGASRAFFLGLTSVGHLVVLAAPLCALAALCIASWLMRRLSPVSLSSPS
jgi:hypothetical protein